MKMNKFNLFSFWVIVLWLAFLVYATTTFAKSEEPPAPAETAAFTTAPKVMILGDVNKPAAEPVTYEDWFRANGNRMDDCVLTHYCCEKRAHICGTGDGITSTGVPVTAEWTCAVDPSVIPYGAEIMVDYGDTVAFYKAQDCGGWIKGKHIDLAVETHAEAEERGVLVVTVYWREV